MGRYINEIEGNHIGVSAKAKAHSLLKAGATEIDTPVEFQEDLVCVVDNGPFGAAAWAYDKREFNVFMHPDERPKRWFIFKDVEKYAE
jgi:hypothetical protein